MRTLAPIGHPSTQLQEAWAQLRLATAAIFISLVAACGGGSSSTASSEGSTGLPSSSGNSGIPDQAAAMELGPAGGTLTGTSAGVSLKMVVPPNAVAAATRFTLTPVAASDGSIAAFDISPVGLVFAAPVTVTLSFPPGTDMAKTVLRLGSGTSRFNLASTAGAEANSLTATLSSFANLSTAPKPVLLRMLEPARRLLALAPEETETLSAAPIQGVGEMVTDAQSHLVDLLDNENFPAAYALQNSVAALLQRTGQDGYAASAIPFLEAARNSACSALAAAINKALDTPITKQGQYAALVRPILYWEAAAQRMGGNPCPAPTAIDAAHTVVARELNLLSEKFDTGSLPAQVSEQMPDIEAARAVTVEIHALQFTGGAQKPVLGPFTQVLQTELLEPALVLARAAAWNARRETGQYDHYKDLIRAFGPQEPLRQDIQYGSTQLSALAHSSSGAVTAVVTMGTSEGAKSPVQAVREANIDLPANGLLELKGKIKVLSCPTTAQEQLVITFEGVEVARLQSVGSQLVSTGLSIPQFSAAQLRAAASLPENDTLPRTMLIKRSSSCYGAFGMVDDVLFTLTIRFNAPAPVLTEFEACFFVNGGVLPVFPARADFVTLSPVLEKGRQFDVINLGEGYRSEFNVPRYQTYVLSSGLSFKTTTTFSGITRTFDFTFSKDESGVRRVDGTLTLVVPDVPPTTYVIPYSAPCDLDILPK